MSAKASGAIGPPRSTLAGASRGPAHDHAAARRSPTQRAQPVVTAARRRHARATAMTRNARQRRAADLPDCAPRASDASSVAPMVPAAGRRASPRAARRARRGQPSRSLPYSRSRPGAGTMAPTARSRDLRQPFSLRAHRLLHACDRDRQTPTPRRLGRHAAERAASLSTSSRLGCERRLEERGDEVLRRPGASRRRRARSARPPAAGAAAA